MPLFTGDTRRRQRTMAAVGFLTWGAVGSPMLIGVAQNPSALQRADVLGWFAAFVLFGLAYAVSVRTRLRGESGPLAAGAVVAMAFAAIAANAIFPLLLSSMAIGGVLLVVSAAAAADHLRWRATAGVVLGQTLGLLGVYLWHWPAAPAFLAAAAFGVFQLFAWGASSLARSESEARRELAASLASLRATQGMLAQNAALAERARIDRELHDALGHNLVVLSLNLQTAAGLCDAAASASPDSGGSPQAARAAEIVRACHGLSRLILSDLRSMVREGREIAPVDLRGALERLAASLPGLTVAPTVEPGADAVDPARAHALFRCAQEFLTNTLKHAGAKSATIRIARENGRIILDARDDGRGSATNEHGAGLRGVRERIAELGGDVRFRTAPGEGFAMTVTLPAPPEPGP